MVAEILSFMKIPQSELLFYCVDYLHLLDVLKNNYSIFFELSLALPSRAPIISFDETSLPKKFKQKV